MQKKIKNECKLEKYCQNLQITYNNLSKLSSASKDKLSRDLYSPMIFISIYTFFYVDLFYFSRIELIKHRKCCQYIYSLFLSMDDLGFLLKENKVIIKDIGLVSAKDPPILKLVNLFQEISNMYCSLVRVCLLTCFLWLYRDNL